MPGKVIKDHAKFESDCEQCHVPFDRAAQARLCMVCHKEVGADVRGARGFHGRLEEKNCKTCHTEHKGRDAKLVTLDEGRFDHTQTDFSLIGKHLGVTCTQCHRSGTKHRLAPATCTGCHRQDDPHKGKLGNKCEQCHSEKSWKEIKFDHAKTRFPLANKHAKTECASCHRDQRFKGTERKCSSCHRKDDTHKGFMGQRCETCHTDASWKAVKFVHDTETRFPLRGRHVRVKCESCHRSPPYSAKLETDCYACHRKDDPHKGSLGNRCQRCHNERSWKAASFDHDRDTRFALRAAHKPVRCESCHNGGDFRIKLQMTCVSCHRQDDPHRNALGSRCEQCHVEKTWKQTRFDHDRDTTYPLRDRHRKLKCQSCHKGEGFREKPPSVCFDCHKSDDKHDGRLGTRCESCHSERGWARTTFDHSRSRFPLEGRHGKVECKSCHVSRAFKDVSTECVSCHSRDDAHKERLGLRCAECHTAQAWKPARFDHDRRSRFKLTGSHRQLSCVRCHTVPVEGRILLGTQCFDCHRRDDVHFAAYGTGCDRCHREGNWRDVDPSIPQKIKDGSITIDREGKR